ncbi:MAG: DUF1491 family protein [Hyphomicrobium sp.]|jgi:hypothetical protein
MRLKSEIWVKAYVRRCASAGRQAYVMRHGDDDAGAIYIRINRLDGTSLLFGPAPTGLDGIASERLWVACLDPRGVSDASVEAFLEREARVDPDVWIVELEASDGSHCLEGWLASTP